MDFPTISYRLCVRNWELAIHTNTYIDIYLTVHITEKQMRSNDSKKQITSKCLFHLNMHYNFLTVFVVRLT